MWSWPLQCPKAFDIVRHQVTITVCFCFLLIFIHCAGLPIWVELHHLSFNPAELQWPRHLTEIQKPRSESWLDLNFIFFSGGFIYKYAGSSIVAGFNTQKTSPSCTVQGTFKCHFLWQTFNSERPFLLWRVNWHKMHYLYVVFCLHIQTI